MVLDELIVILANFDFWIIAKVFLLMGLLLYVVFAFIVIREVNLMNRTLIGVFNLPIKIISWLHFIFTILVFILALIIL